MEKISVVIGSDHAGFELKQELLAYVNKYHKRDYEAEDCGTYQDKFSVDYADIAHDVVNKIRSHKADLGILICGSGIGMSMAANRHPQIRCAVCWSEDIATLAKEHNDANIIALPAQFLTQEDAKRILDAFLDANFQKGRHSKQIKKIEIL